MNNKVKLLLKLGKNKSKITITNKIRFFFK
jgi:hypothetical protein